ncbi:hypothetical protein FRC08_006529 [Ceratobasidium sp. 394]|nr:hypothetical protein FRC08_006529 [Ceratobasidium sp. 394]
MGTLFEPNVHIDQLLSTWSTNSGPSDEEVIKYATDVTKQLENGDMQKTFIENVAQVGTWANQVDEAFDRVTKSFAKLKNDIGKELPEFGGYNDQWIEYNKRWVTHLAKSRDVASKNASIVRRFDQVFLATIDDIKTDQDRQDAIKELEAFTNERNDELSTEMYQGFLNLKRDIEDFVKRLYAFIESKNTELLQRAKEVKIAIDTLKGDIDDLDGKIKDATTALAATGACLLLIGVVIAGSVLAAYQSNRDDKIAEFLGKQKELEEVNRKQEKLAHLKSEFDAVQPDISLICEKLLLFAEIWSAVRSQTVQFIEQLKGGMNALTNLRFKKELRLARAMCEPLRKGLEEYATKLENRRK